jgi:peroxiredoxin
MLKRFCILFFILGLSGNLFFAGSVPEFSLKRIDGSTFNLSEVKGKKIIVIDFWATWCKPCKKLLKRLNKIYLDFYPNVEVLAISVDDSSAFSEVESYIKGRRFKFTVLLDPDSRVSKVFNPTQKIPFTLILDFQGEIEYTHTGYIPGVEIEIKKVIKKILGSPKS